MSASTRLFTTLLVSVLVTSACASISAPEPPDKILFIGNSFTWWNDGLDHHIEQLAGSADPPLVIETDSATKSAVPLESIWEYSKAREVISEGDYDVVVLQETMQLTSVDTFHEYARKFDVEIKEAGAETVLFMAWSSGFQGSRYILKTTEEIAQAHRDIATELGVDVAPVGLAFHRAMEERPELVYVEDADGHPSIHGTYLAVNVVYATVFGQSPIGLAGLPTGVSEEEAAFLQRIAWETVQEYQAQQ